MHTAHDSIQPLYDALTNFLLPWAEHTSSNRVVLARPWLSELTRDLPRGVEAVPRKLVCKKPVTRTVRYYNYTMPTDHFPADGVEATTLPVITCILSGPAQLEVSDYVLRCEAGNFVMFPPGVLHPDGMHAHLQKEFGDYGSAEIFWLYHWKDGVICHTCRSHGRTHQTATTHCECYVTSRQALLCFETMVEEMAKPGGGDLRVHRNLLSTLLITLRYDFEIGNYIQPGAAITGSPLSPEEDPILQAAHYIRFHLNEALTIDSVARKYYMSRSQFTKRFREKMGVSFLEFVSEQRLEKVKTLLRDTDWSLDTVCQLSGLRLSNLRIVLRNRTGLSPLEYRRQARDRKET